MFLVGQDGRCLLKIRGTYYSDAEAHQLAAALHVPVDPSWESPGTLVSESQLEQQIPGAAIWLQRRPSLAWAAVAVLVLLTAVVTLVALSRGTSTVPQTQPTTPTLWIQATSTFGHTYQGVWRGTAVPLTPTANATVEGYSDARLVGSVVNFQTNDPRYTCLSGLSINVFTAPREFPSQYVVHDGSQGAMCVYGTWTFPQSSGLSR
jgi:hypothetical protein